MTINKTKSTRIAHVLGLTFYILCLMLPIYWLVNMSFKENQEILGSLSFFPAIIKSDFKLFNFINDLIETLYNLEIE